MHEFNDMLPLVSIITPVFNGSRYIEELIESVRCQSYANIEHIIIDDGSTDNGATVNILKKYPHLRWWSRENKGQYATLNEGILAARGDIISIISADDYYASTSVISLIVNTLKSHPKAFGAYGYTIIVNEIGVTLPAQPPKRLPMWALSSYLFISHCSLFVRSDIINKHRILFDESLIYRGDQKWILSIVESGLNLLYINKPISKYRYHNDQTTQNADIDKRNVENKLIDKEFKINRFVRFLVKNYVFSRHRVYMALWLIETGGLRTLISYLRRWLVIKIYNG